MRPEDVKKLLDYAPETGKLLWRPRVRGMFQSDRSFKSWNARNAGKEAGSLDEGYIRISLNGQLFRAHRIAWMIFYGENPTSLIDHANGVRNDNRISNLRKATASQNSINCIQTKVGKTSKYKGVYLCRGKWRARINIETRRIDLGYFESEILAFEAYKIASLEYHKEFARL